MANTTSTARLTYVDEPDGRGTVDLLWTCLGTVFLCTWTIQRLDIPSSTPKMSLLYRKITWMIITLLVPEYVAWIAFDQWISAKKSLAMKDLGYDWWSLRHGFCADMGGFAVTLNARPRFQAASDGLVSEIQDAISYPLRWNDLEKMTEKNAIAIPRITAEVIDERSKTDYLAQSVTFIQVSWFVLTTVARVAKHLPISALEVSTLAFVSCAAAVAFFWWEKPLDFGSSTVIKIPIQDRDLFLSMFEQLDFSPSEQELAERIAPREWFVRTREIKDKAVHMVWIGCVFNGIHVTAWDFSFPSNTELLLWRICSIAACLSVLGMYLTFFVHSGTLNLVVGFGIGAPIYIAARLFLIVEVFLSLRSLPAGVYQDLGWDNFLPHV